MNPNFQS